MDYSSRLNISYHKVIAPINEAHKVYLSMHQQTGKICIKKILDVYNVNVFQQLKNMHLSGIPAIIDYYEENDTLCVIEEFINGISLSESMCAHTLDKDTISKYVLYLCNTLEQLHAMNPPIIHRDIKPSNIIIDRNNNPILIDFNAAKNFSNNQSNDTVLIGTQGYAAPEQYGFGSSTQQTDIYSMGILIKELVSSLSEKCTDFDGIISKCTQMNPSERYSSVTELKEAVTNIDNPYFHLSTSPNSWLPPGYRSKTPWKMFVSTIAYMLIIASCFFFTVENETAAQIWIGRFTCLTIFLMLIAGTFNYKNIHTIFPICKHPSPFVKLIGIFILDLLLTLLTLAVFIMIDYIFFNQL